VPTAEAEAAEPLADDEICDLLEPFSEQRKILLAVSGGSDSFGMLAAFARWRSLDDTAPAILVASVDHGLRPEAARECARVMDAAARFGLPAAILKWEGEKPASGLQEAAREARYRLLGRFARAERAEAVLIAHTADDQAETVLMRLLRGSGLKGLAGMDNVAILNGVPVFRPLLTASKARLVATCEARGWRYLVDPSNDNPGFLRARLRRIAPLLAQEGLTPARLSRLAGRMRRADDALDGEALAVMERSRIWRTGETVYDAAGLAAAHEEIVVRVFQHVLALGRGADSGHVHPRLERIEALALDFRRAVVDGVSFRRNAGGLLFTLRKGELVLRSEPARRPRRLNLTADCSAPPLGNGAEGA